MKLDKIRQQIDQIDTQMKELFLKRMELSAQVIATKKETGGAVFVPEREAEIIKNRSEDIKENVSEYQMFIKQVMGISRTYQYSKIVDTAEELTNLPMGEGEVTFKILDKNDEMRLSFMLDAIVLAGLLIQKLSKIEKTKDGSIYQLTVSGDFSKELARGAILQIYREMEQVL